MSTATTNAASTLHADAAGAAGSRTLSSLPAAGLRVPRAGDQRCAPGLFTTHRADPSWT